MTRVSRVLTTTVLTLVLGLAVAACGDDGTTTASDPGSSGSATSSGSSSESPSVDTSTPAEPSPSESQMTPTETADPLPDWPTCTDVWVADKTLPRGYAGCLEDQTAVKASNQYCEFGQKLVTYANQYWAVRGGKVNDAEGPLEQSQDYKNDLASCKG